MATVTYEIDEAERTVYVLTNGRRHPHHHARFADFEFVGPVGQGYSSNPERQKAYLVARDELLERGLIEEAT